LNLEMSTVKKYLQSGLNELRQAIQLDHEPIQLETESLRIREYPLAKKEDLEAVRKQICKRNWKILNVSVIRKKTLKLILICQKKSGSSGDSPG